jgi:hypothetical protein
MLNHQTMEKLHALRLTGMADAYRQQMEDAEMAGLSFEERFGLLVDQHWTWRENQAMARRLKKSKLDAEPCVEDIDFRHPRGLDRPLMRIRGGVAGVDGIHLDGRVTEQEGELHRVFREDLMMRRWAWC